MTEFKFEFCNTGGPTGAGSAAFVALAPACEAESSAFRQRARLALTSAHLDVPPATSSLNLRLQCGRRGRRAPARPPAAREVTGSAADAARILPDARSMAWNSADFWRQEDSSWARRRALALLGILRALALLGSPAATALLSYT